MPELRFPLGVVDVHTLVVQRFMHRWLLESALVDMHIPDAPVDWVEDCCMPEPYGCDSRQNWHLVGPFAEILNYFGRVH